MNINEVCEYVKDEHGYWQHRRYRNITVFQLDLHQSHIQISTIRLGLTKAFGARATEWCDIHLHIRELLTPELLDQSGYNHLIKIGGDFFGVCGVCDKQHRTDYYRRKRRKTKTYFLRYLEHKAASVLDLGSVINNIK